MEVYYLTILAIFFTSGLANRTGRKKQTSLIYVDVNKNNFFAFVTGVILIMVAGLRWRVGTDYYMYAIGYSKHVALSWTDLSILDEPGLKIISIVSQYIYDDYATMFFLASLITIGLIVNTIYKRGGMFSFSILLFIFIGMWTGSFNGVRQYIALAILFAGHHFIVDRNIKKYVFVVIIASLFHISAIGMIILYFVPIKKLSLKHIIILIGFTMFFLYSYGYIFEVLESIKDTELSSVSYMSNRVNPYRILVSFAPLAIYFLLTNINLLKRNDYFYINMLFINAAITLATSNSAYLMRFAIYTNSFLVLGIPKLLNFEDKLQRAFIKFIIISAYAVFWYIDVTKSSSLVQFKWIFQR